MTDVTLGVITRLKNNTKVCASTTLGANPNQRIYRASLPSLPTFPCAVVNKIDTRRLNFTHNGRAIAQSRVQVTVFATTDSSADSIAELIADDLHGINNAHLGSGLYAVRVDDAGGRIDANPEIGKFLNHRDFLIQHYY